MDFNFTSQINPDMYLRQFATQNQLSTEEAKIQLQAKYGDPQMGALFFQRAIDSNIEESLVQFSPEDETNKPVGQFPNMPNAQMPSATNQGMGQPYPSFPNGNNGNMSVSGNQKQDPDEYAKEYATANGITLEEAKAELKAKYGDPQKNNDSTNATVSGTQKQDPDEYAKEYATANGITLDEAKAQLKAQFGDPQKQQ